MKMGVDISKILTRHEISLSELKGKRIAIDSFNALYQFLASIRQPDGTPLKDFKGNVTSHLSGIFYRTINLLENGITPIYVFDGEIPKFKLRELENRKEKKKHYEELVKKAVDQDLGEETISSYKKATVRLTRENVLEVKELLSAMGICVVEAPSEGEAQAAALAASGKVDASASQDYDSMLFGAPCLIRNLSITGKRKLPRKDEYIIVHPEKIFLHETLKELEISREQLICIGLLIGTDFNEGIDGIGPKKALAIVKDRSFEEILQYAQEKHSYSFEPDIKEIYEFFLHPKSRDVELKEGSIDDKKIFELLVEKHDFSFERVSTALEKMRNAINRKKQSSLKQWFE